MAARAGGYARPSKAACPRKPIFGLGQQNEQLEQLALHSATSTASAAMPRKLVNAYCTCCSRNCCCCLLGTNATATCACLVRVVVLCGELLGHEGLLGRVPFIVASALEELKMKRMVVKDEEREGDFPARVGQAVVVVALRKEKGGYSEHMTLTAMDSSVPTDPNNAKDYMNVHLERIMNSIEKEAIADVGSSGVATDVGSSGAGADVGSSWVVVAEEKLSEKNHKRIKLVTTKVQGSKSVVYGTFRNRMSPSSVVNVFKKLSEDQLIAIRAIGFGSLQFLKVSLLPLQLGFWLVKQFDAQSCSLNIPDSEPFKITEQHVHEVLGLPVGGMEIDANVFSKDDKVITQWKKQFKKNSLSVNIGELSLYLKNHKSARPMFKRNFVVLCVSTLMSGGQNKNVNHDILRYLTSVDKINDLNWSKFILDSLVKAEMKWDELPTRYFTGSLLFLMGFLLDTS
uniref:Uncharacterized protein n=1 Tax=Chenopodium quinoa TaxID=63459 RepID=A0A803N4T6_CHEQI